MRILLMLLFSACPAVYANDAAKVHQDKKTVHQTYTKTKLSKNSNKPPENESKNQSKQTAKAPVQTGKKSRKPLSKEALLPKTYSTAKKTEKQLNKEFHTQLTQLESICRISKNRKKELDTQLENFKDFLSESLKDPYIAYTLQLKFRDILSLIASEQTKNINTEAFSLSYRRLYNLPEDIKPEDYPDLWAKALYESIKCAEQFKYVFIPIVFENSRMGFKEKF